MSHIFDHSLEAHIYLPTVTSIPARTALQGIHTLLLEVSGSRLQFLPERYRPIRPLDILFFYQAVERLFAEWTDEIRSLPEAPGNRDRLLQLQEAEALIPTLPTERAQVGLANFLSILLATPIPAGTFIDALFCSRLLSALLSYPGYIDLILSGEAEKAAIYEWGD